VLLAGKSSEAAVMTFCFFCAFLVQLGSNIKYSVFKSESTGAALKGWVKTAKKKHNDPNHVHTPLGSPHDSSHDSSSQDSKPHVHIPHVGILGLTKALDEHGRPVDIPHNGHTFGNGHLHGLPHAPPATHGMQSTPNPKTLNPKP